MIHSLQNSAFRAVTQLFSLILAAFLISLWAVTWPIFEFSDWIAGVVTDHRLNRLKAKTIQKKIGFGPRVVGSMLTFIASVRQMRQFERVSRSRRSRGDFDAGSSSASSEMTLPPPGGDQHKGLNPMIKKMATG